MSASQDTDFEAVGAPRTTRPVVSLRWSTERAAREFGLDRKTLANRILQTSTIAGEDGKYSTLQILTAVAGDLEREKTRNEAAAADLREMKRDLEKHRLVPVDLVGAMLDELKIVISQVIDHSPLLLVEKEQIYRNLRKLDVTEWAAQQEDKEGDEDE